MTATRITVTGTYVDATGTPCTGRVAFRPVVPAGNTNPARLVYDQYVDVALSAGALSVQLVASDDPDWAMDGPVQYYVLENIDGRQDRGYIISVEGPGPVDLSSMQPQTLTVPQVATVRGPAGPGAIAVPVGQDIPEGTPAGTVIVRYNEGD